MVQIRYFMMKYPLLLLLLFFGSYLSPALPTEKDTDKIATFIKIWGFLKYYHPEVAKGSSDWDEAFRTGIKAIGPLQSRQELNAYYLKWINGLGKVNKCGSCKPDMDGVEKYNTDMRWLRDKTHFDPELIATLTYIQQNRNQKTNHYVSAAKGAGNPVFNEKSYKDSIFPSAELRLLTLARYWNIVHYFFPYRYQTNQNWNQVLTEMIPEFSNTLDTTAYHLTILKLTAKIDDSHAKFSTLYTGRHFGLNWVPFKFKIIDNKAVVTGFYSESLARKDDIRIGDVFLKMNGHSITQLLDKNDKYIGASNPSVKRRDAYALFNGNSDGLETEYERDGIVAKKTISRIKYRQLGYIGGQDNPKDTIRMLEGNIGYVHMGNLTVKQVPRLIETLQNTKTIIFDVRNYPKGTLYELANFLNPKPAPFVKITAPQFSYPGSFAFMITLYCGKNNPDYYKGKVILLCDESTQSHAEFTLMALQTAPHVTTIGSQTSGADGNVSLITLPGNFQTYITGLGIYYPDGRETQRIGIVPDILVSPTIKGIRAGRDEVLEKALEVARQKI